MHTTAHVEYPEFYVGDTLRRDVTSKAYTYDIVEGDNVCKYGRSTLYDCTEIYRVNVSRTLEDGRSVDNQVAVQSRLSAGGDSGGPWFLGNKAYGVHSGWVTIDGVERDVFTPAYNISNAFDANVRLK